MHLGKLVRLVAGLLVSLCLLTPLQANEPDMILLPSPSPCGPPLSAKLLLRMDACELEALYRQASAGSMPVGYYPGKAIWSAGTKMTVPLACLTSAIWQGKTFDPCTNLMTNKNWLPSTKAKVFYGPSWLDGQPSIIMDYAETSKLVGTIRDEIREVAPGLYLGIMYARRDCDKKFRNYFVLEASSGCCLDCR